MDVEYIGKSKPYIRFVRWENASCPEPPALWGRPFSFCAHCLYLHSVTIRSPFTTVWAVNEHTSLILKSVLSHAFLCAQWISAITSRLLHHIDTWKLLISIVYTKHYAMYAWVERLQSPRSHNLIKINAGLRSLHAITSYVLPRLVRS